MKWSKELPDKEGYYWWFGLTLEAPMVIEVKRDYRTGYLWAEGGEYSFSLKPEEPTLFDEPIFEFSWEEQFYREWGALDLYCYIEEPTL